ncbi:MAG TPA: hypothetical protein VFL12_08840 [Thermoanaerobaculia bacterium]|nr:hypothetical protein [Thermoanaerobaculia bacterium]
MSSPRNTSDTEPVSGSTFWLEIVVYSVLIVGYLFLVLKTLDRPIARLYEQHRVSYAFAAVLLILLQGIVLELLTKILVGLFRPNGRLGRRR